MYHEIEEWINNTFNQTLSPAIAAFCFNLYEDEDDNWSMELVGTGSFDLNNEDWACDEITDFGTREKPFSWHKKADWNEILEEMTLYLKQYLESGTYSNILKAHHGVGVGFVGGDIEILYVK